MAAKTKASVGLTPKSRLAMTRAEAEAAPRPSRRPASASAMPCRVMSRRMSPRCAPRAMRTPISCVRWLTA